MKAVILPELGEGIQKATIACWHYRVGEEVVQDEDLLEVVTDKATFNICASQSGPLKEICFKEGQEAKIGDVLAVIG